MVRDAVYPGHLRILFLYSALTPATSSNNRRLILYSTQLLVVYGFITR